MRGLKRAVCFIWGHNQTHLRYPAQEPGLDAPEGWFLKCVRCGKVTEREPLPPGPGVVGF